MAATWKEAASLIIVSKKILSYEFGQNLSQNFISSEILSKTNDRKHNIIESIKNTDYCLLMVKRNRLSSFMSNAYVFPGGKLEESDFLPYWWKVFDQLNISKENLIDFSKKITGTRPPLINQSLTLKNVIYEYGTDDYLPVEIALRIAAIREAFEETGILLLKNSNDNLENNNADINLSDWRDKIRKNSSNFFNLCLKLNKCPNIWLLNEWSNWLTPISVGYKRFDTMFYICFLEDLPDVILDNKEVTDLKWITPIEILEEHIQGRILMAPPQVYELSRFYHYKTYNEFKNHVLEREIKGVERWLPVLATYNDGTLSALPGDSMYPKNPDYIGVKPIKDYSINLKETFKLGEKLNRIILKKNLCFARCNQEIPNGHFSPITYCLDDQEIPYLKNKL